jgi:hypothetical protein
MGENVPYTSYLSQKEHSFIKKCIFATIFNLCESEGVKNAPLKSPG